MRPRKRAKETMITFRTTLCAASFALLFLPSCKSKLEKCTDVCAKIRAEDEERCSGDKSCVAGAKEKSRSCTNLCETAFGDKKSSGKSKSTSDDDDDDEEVAVSPADKDEKACTNKDDKDACANTAGRYLLGKDGRSKDESKAVPIAKKACDLGSGFGCELYGRILDDGRGVPKDPAGAMSAFKKACDLKSGGACRSLGLRADSNASRVILLKEACDLEDGMGCAALGAAYLHGNQGTPKDLTKAKELLDKGCRLGQKAACEKVAEIPSR
jgi:hypothetical protein